MKGGDSFNDATIKNLEAFRDRVQVLAENAERLSITDAAAFAKTAESLDQGGFARDPGSRPSDRQDAAWQCDGRHALAKHPTCSSLS